MNRAYSLIEVKSLDESRRTFSGMATTPDLDRVNDTINPLGAKFKNPLVLLHQHDSDRPIGSVRFKAPTVKGIEFDAEIPVISEPGPLKDRVDTAWGEIKNRLVRAVSIGFRPLKYAFKEDGGVEFQEIEIFELSVVSVPANASALISNVGKSGIAATIKQFDKNAPAASGRPERSANVTPPASGKSITITRPKEGQKAMQNVGAQIAALEAQRKEKALAMEAIQKAVTEAGRTKNEEERLNFDKLRDELKVLDAEIADLKDIEALYSGTVQPVGDNPPAPRYTVPPVPKKEVPKGIRFAQLVKVRAVSQLDIMPMAQVAEKMYGRDSEIAAVIKAGEQVPGANASGNWASDLVSAEGGIAADFAEYLRAATILGKFGQGGIPALRNVPFRKPLILGTGGGAGYWVGEGKPKPLTQLDFDRTTLSPLKCATIAVLTMENIRDSSPSSDAIVRDELRKVLATLEDVAFIDPENAGSANVKPAGIPYGSPFIFAQSYSDETDVILDIRSLLQKFIDANNPASQAVLIMEEGTALAAGLILNALGQRAFPTLGMRGGSLLDIPVITSESVPAGVVVIVNASDIHYADDGEIAVDMSREASLEFKDQANITQNGIAGTGASLVSLWQNNLVGIRAEHTVNWRRRRASAVAYLKNVAWGGAVAAS